MFTLDVADLIERQLPSKYSLDEVRKTVDIYSQNVHQFGNKEDFTVARRLVQLLPGPAPTILVCGAHHGESMSNILQVCDRATIHGFEIQQQAFVLASQAFRGRDNVSVHHLGLSDHVGTMPVTGSGETAGVYVPEGRWAHEAQQGTVNVAPVSHFLETQGIDKVDYFVIDVEGHEQEVIKGMRLETNAPKFPVFQYELGGTWADSRRTGPWTQFTMAFYLELLGYDLYLMGTVHGNAVLLRVGPEFFRYSSANYEGYENGGQKYFVQGNALAVHAVHADASIREAVSSITVG